MKDLFSGFYRPSDDEFQKIWKECTFILDTNILLNMYRYPEELSDRLYSILESLSKRIWIPYQVALEFQKDRLLIIAEQKRRFGEVKNILEDFRSSLESKLNDLQLKKRHSSIQTDELTSGINEHIDEYLKNLDEQEKVQLSVTDNDPLRERIDGLLKNRIGKSYSKETIDKIYKEGEERYRKFIPPGYEDLKKEGSDKNNFFYQGGIIYENKFGDLVLWKQIIDKAKNDSLDTIIFITDDNKEDWWYYINSQGKKKIGPRPELIDEIKKEADVKFFHMYDSEQFLQYAKEYLNVDIKDEQILQIGEISKTPIKTRRIGELLETYKFRKIATNSVYIWLNEVYPSYHLNLTEKPGSFDIIMNDENSKMKFGIIVRYLSRPHFSGLLQNRIYRSYEEVLEGSFDEIKFILTFPDAEMANRFFRSPERRMIEIPPKMSIYIGYLNIINKEKWEADFILTNEF